MSFIYVSRLLITTVHCQSTKQNINKTELTMSTRKAKNTVRLYIAAYKLPMHQSSTQKPIFVKFVTLSVRTLT